MKRFISLLFIFSIAYFAIDIYAQDYISVQGKEYEGTIQGMATISINFQSDSTAVFTMSVFGNKERKSVTYEQMGNQIVVHAQNGNMTFTQNNDDELTTNIKGTLVKLTCQTSTTVQDQLENVMGHTFSGDLRDGRLTLSFTDDGVVNVSIYMNGQYQNESWPYTQDGGKIILTEPMGRKITLTLNGKNELKGLFTIINVTLPLVE